MGTQLQSTQCPHCETTYTHSNGPDFMSIPAPAPSGWTVVLLTCTGCKRFMGVYTYPPQEQS